MVLKIVNFKNIPETSKDMKDKLVPLYNAFMEGLNQIGISDEQFIEIDPVFENGILPIKVLPESISVLDKIAALIQLPKIAKYAKPSI